MLIQGTTSGSIMSTGLNIPCYIKSFTVFNKTGAARIVKIGIVVSGIERYLFNINLAAIGTANSSFYQLTDIEVPISAEIIIVADGEIDYTVTLD